MKIKICGLFRECDIDYVNEALPDFIGFVFAPGSRRQVSADQAKNLRRKLKPEVIPVGVFVNETMATVAQMLKENVIEMAQLHGTESEKYILELKVLTGKPVIKAVRVSSAEDIFQAGRTAADYLLLDNGTGGTGMTFNWHMLNKEEQLGKPYFLAGGLNIANLDQALSAVRPFALDLSSGVETNGIKDRKKILEIVKRVRYV
ncbi:MAG: phosphoribosylanthranilate isomerase [Desulfitobacteriaceae bacterium]|nr:phosphoribosylanthranilate isomerase [Desulfitobacteriaceae bacterium]MDD4402298.1 phosphoribosylanthranilate isomerase [Desulfitobacteriaceae bacterium]